MRRTARIPLNERFCLNAATIKRSSLEQQIQITSAAGFRAIGLWIDDIETALTRGVALGDVADWLKQAGLKVVELCFVGGWQDATEEAFARVVGETQHLCQVARGLGCDLVVAVPALGPGSLDAAPARFRTICLAAAEHEVRIALEFPWTVAEVNNLTRAWQVVATAGCENGGLVLDWFHFSLGGSSAEELARIPGESLFLVHLSDAMDIGLEKLRSHHDNRTFPGEGTLDYAPLFQALEKLDYQGPLSLEIWNRNLAAADPAEVAQRGFSSLLRLEQLARSAATRPEFQP